MNNAATKAIGSTSKVFLSDIKLMSKTDIRVLVGDNESALRDYLQGKSSAKLKTVICCYKREGNCPTLNHACKGAKF